MCLATVPFAIGYERKGIPEEHWHSGVSFPLADSRALVPFLRQQIGARRVTIALHGYTHEDYPDGYEFQSAPDPERRLAHGLELLRNWPRHDYALRAASQRVVEAWTVGGQRSRPQSSGIVPVVPAVDASLGCSHAGQLVAGPRLSIGDRPLQERSLRLSAFSDTGGTRVGATA